MGDANQIVTDHALIRWLERVDGIDMEKIRDEAHIVTGERPETDHQLIGYMRRYHRLDARAIRRKIATAEVRALIRAGIRHIPVMDRKFRLLVSGEGTIKTVRPVSGAGKW